MERRQAASSLPRFSLDRRITVLVILLTALVVGGVAASWIPLELIPSGYTEESLRITIPWRDAPPREVLDKLAEPVEEELRTVRGIDRIVSVSVAGAARIFMRFKQGTDMDVAYREVRDRVERSRTQLPDDVDNIFIRKDDTSGIPVYVLGIAVNPSVLDAYDLIQRQIIAPLERVDGVASVAADGLEQREILIELDRERTEGAGLNIYDLAQELAGDNFTMASGTVVEGAKKLLLRSVARYDDLAALENRPINQQIRLGDIADISYEEPEKDYRVRAMSKPAFAVIVFKEGQANGQEVSAKVHALFDELQTNPRLSDVEMVTLFNTGAVVSDALKKLLQSGMVGAVIAGIVLFLFLRRLRLTAVINLSVPLSLLIALTIMYFAGETLNILTLLALMVCIGLLVDNSIVVSENIDRMYQGGLSAREACIQGAGEIGLAITMSTLTTVIVFLPVALVEGPGQFFLLRMAIPISVALVASLFVALVFVPLSVYLTLGRRRANGAVEAGYSRAMQAIERAYDVTFQRLERIYGGMLAVFLGRRLDLIVIFLIVTAITAGVAKDRVKIVEMQEDEEAGFELSVEMPAENTLEETEAWFLDAEKIVEGMAEELDLAGWFLYHDRSEGELQGWFNSPRTKNLKPRDVTQRVLEAIPESPGVKLTTGNEDQLDDEASDEIFQLQLFGENPDQLGTLIEELEDVVTRVPGVLGARKTYRSMPNELGLAIDRSRAQQYRVNPAVVAGVVGYALRGQSLPEYRTEGKEIPVRVRFKEEDRENLDQLASFYVPTLDGGVLPVSAVTDVRMLSSPEAIVRRDKRISRSLTLELEKETEEETRKRLSAFVKNIDLPEGVTFSAATRSTGFDEDLLNLFMALILSVIFIYLLMGLLFESVILPLSIIFTIPLAGLGVFWIHILTGRDIDFLGMVGIVLLVGVVVNNGIVLIDYVNRLREEGLARGEAILRAAHLRFRPIMMTAITTIGGMVPLAIAGRTEIGLSYTSFALTLIGGMTTATLLTLLVVPVFYTLFDDLQGALTAGFRWAMRRDTRGDGAVRPAPPAVP